jgi:signal transduction histidine kinase
MPAILRMKLRLNVSKASHPDATDPNLYLRYAVPRWGFLSGRAGAYKVDGVAMLADSGQNGVDEEITAIPLARPMSELKQLRRKIAELERRAREESGEGGAEDGRLLSDQPRRLDSDAEKRRLAYLAEASLALAASLDYPTTLSIVTQLAVSELADWCFLDLAEDGQWIRRVGARLDEPSQPELVSELQAFNGPELDPPRGVRNALRTGQLEIHSDVPDALLMDLARNAGDLQIIRKLGIKSVMVLPLSARERSLGTLMLLSTCSGRRYGAAEMSLAGEFARRAAFAIDNARLYRESQEALKETQQLYADLEERADDQRRQLDAAERNLPEEKGANFQPPQEPQVSPEDNGHALALQPVNGAVNAGAECERLLSDIISKQSAMGEFIDDLRAFARLGRQQMELADIDMKNLASEVYEELKPMARSGSIEFRLGPLPEAYADPHLMREVFLNLLSNAVKFTRLEDKPLIEVGGRVEDDRVVYSVKDNGVGFDSGSASKLFGMFQRLHPESKYPGTGVGLATVERLVERHGGSVWAEGEIDRGATFYFSLPKKNPRAGALRDGWQGLMGLWRGVGSGFHVHVEGVFRWIQQVYASRLDRKVVDA